jgi:hypothetical protein
MPGERAGGFRLAFVDIVFSRHLVQQRGRKLEMAEFVYCFLIALNLKKVFSQPLPSQDWCGFALLLACLVLTVNRVDSACGRSSTSCRGQLDRLPVRSLSPRHAHGKLCVFGSGLHLSHTCGQWSNKVAFALCRFSMQVLTQPKGNG